jgi:hypothetical protein
MLDRWIARLRAPSDQAPTGAASAPVFVSEATGHITLVTSDAAWAARAGAVVDASHPNCDRTIALTPDEWVDAAEGLRTIEVVVASPPTDPQRADALWKTLATLRPMPAFVVLASHETRPRLPSALRPVTWLPADEAGLAALPGAVADALERTVRARAEASRDLWEAIEAPSPTPHEASRPFVELLRARTLSPADESRCVEALEATLETLPRVTREEALELLGHRAAEQLDEVGFTHCLSRLDGLTGGRASQEGPWATLRQTLAPRLHAAIDRQLELARMQRRLGQHAGVVAVCDAVDQRLANILPAGFLRAEAQRHLGELEAAADSYIALSDGLLSLGEVAHARRLLRYAASFGPHAAAEERIAVRLEAIARAEAACLEHGKAVRWPCMWVCGRAMCQEVAEASGGLWRRDPSEACDVCDWGVLGRIEALQGLTLAVVGGPLGRAYKDALLRLGAREVRHHPGLDAPEGVHVTLADAQAVVLVGGAAIHAGWLRAERLLLAEPRPTARVRFYGVRQIVRAVALELAPQLASSPGGGQALTN